MIIVLLIAWRCAPPTAKNHKYLYMCRKTLATAARAWQQSERGCDTESENETVGEGERATNEEQKKVSSPHKRVTCKNFLNLKEIFKQTQLNNFRRQ